MSLPHHENSENLPEAAPEYPWMHVVHDGTQPDVSVEEQALVTGAMVTLVDDLMLSHDAYVERYPGQVPYLNLGLTVDSGERWEVTVRPEGHSTVIGMERRQILLARYRDERPAEYTAYRQKPDGAIRRWDQPAQAANMRAIEIETRPQIIDPIDFEYDDEPDVSTLPNYKAMLARRLVAQETTLETIVRDQPNERLEQALGLNNQLVGLPEIQSLSNFLTQPGMVPRPTHP